MVINGKDIPLGKGLASNKVSLYLVKGTNTI
jgi:hypothetical protein